MKLNDTSNSGKLLGVKRRERFATSDPKKYRRTQRREEREQLRGTRK